MKLGSEWGKYTWIFFHCLAEKIKPSSFIAMKYTLINWIKQISGILPCPYCSEHATNFLQQYKNYHTINTKDEFKNFLLLFHNSTNKKINKYIQPTNILKQYENYDFRTATANWYNNFIVNKIDVRLRLDKNKRNNIRIRILNELGQKINNFNI